MGFIEFIKRKQEEAAARNKAIHESKVEYYNSPEFKKDIANKEKEGKGSDFVSYLKRVSKKAAAQFDNETIKIDADKLIGKKSK